MVAIKPVNMSHEEAAAVITGASTALYFLKKGGIKKGHNVLIYGASGSNGTFAVQLAKYFGAEITGVCSTTNLELVKSLGAEKVIDYTKEDFSEREERYDLVFDAVGKATKSQCAKVLAPGGKFVTVLKGSFQETNETLIFLKELIEDGKLKSVIDRSYPFEKMSEAHAYVDLGHKKGNITISLGI